MDPEVCWEPHFRVPSEQIVESFPLNQDPSLWIWPGWSRIKPVRSPLSLHKGLNWAFTRFKHLASCFQPAIRQTSPLLDSPVDIICTILDELPLTAWILLSQTCKALWYRMRERNAREFWRLSSEERLKTLTELVQFLPDHYLCYTCAALHSIDLADIPANNKGFLLADGPCLRDQYMHWSRRTGDHTIGFRHVHLACKYARMTTTYQDYREQLLQKVTTNGDWQGLTVRIITEPRIVRNRFVVMTTYTASAGLKPHSIRSLNDANINFCRHAGFSTLGIAVLDDPFTISVLEAFRRLDRKPTPKPKCFSCPECPTDISFIVKEDEPCVVAWTDLGVGLSFEESCWESQIVRLDQPSDRKLAFEFSHGRVRDLYLSNRS